MRELTAFLKVDLSRNQRKDVFVAFMDADLGDEYKRASSPKPYPACNIFFAFPSIYTPSSPS